MRTILHIAGELVLFAGVSYYFQVRTRILGNQIKELHKVVEEQNQAIAALQQQVDMLIVRVSGGSVVQPLPVVPVTQPTPAPVRIPIARRQAPKILPQEEEEEQPVPIVKKPETSIEDLDEELAEELGELNASAKE